MTHTGLLLTSFLLTLLSSVAIAQNRSAADVVLAVHGGTGRPRGELAAEVEKEMREALRQAAAAGYAEIKANGTSIDAVEAAVKVLEDSPHFNAGKGAVFTHEGRNEMDASIMNGRDKDAGAVAAVTTIRNPISAARAVMDKSKTVMLISSGAENFARDQKLEIVSPLYFWTQRRWDELQKQLEEEKQGKTSSMILPAKEYGTVGAVAIDASGNLAAGTSTGGLTNKPAGRIGDSPIIGAGTYADNDSCAVSGTGVGEYFIRFTVAHEIAVLVKYKGLTVSDAAKQVIDQITADGGRGGVIALDNKGNLAFPYSSAGLSRAYVTRDGQIHVAMYDE